MARILVVDDDRDLREDLGEVLKDVGFDTVLAENGTKALDLLEKESIDLVLLDSIMPGMTGSEVLILIKRLYPRIKVVIMTAFSTVDSAVEVMRKGADDYITKPFKINDLLVSIKRSLEEASFAGCSQTSDMDDIFKCLANSTRRQILLILREHGQLRFMDIVRKLDIDDHTKVNFHLKNLKDNELLLQDGKKNYSLTEKGKNILACMATMSS